jgi:hypothetical protein
MTLYLNGTTGVSGVDGSAGTPAIQGTDTNTGISFPAADTIAFNEGGAEVGRFDSSGRLLVGTSSSSSTSRAVFQGNSGGSGGFAGLVKVSFDTTSPGSTADIGRIAFTDSGHGEAATISGRRDGGTWTSGSSQPTALVFSTCPDSGSSPVERMRINSSGALKASSVSYQDGVSPRTHLLFNKNNASGDICLYLGMDGNAINTSSNMLVCTHIGVSDVLYIRGNGNVLNANNSYGAISDIKLKENIVDATSQWDDLKALQVRKYNFKEGQTHTQIGLIAQEAELVSPGLVNESRDQDAEGNDLGTVTKSVNYSVLYMKAVKALQEAMERIEQLETEMAAVKAQLS